METFDLKKDIPFIDTRSLVDKVEIKLTEIFIEKELKPGDKIPKEVDLAILMGVSRTVIRESINRLKTLGIIESIKHEGTIIKSPDLAALLQKSLLPSILNDQTLKEIYEFRLVIEIGMADLIVNRVKPTDIDDLYRIVAKEPDNTKYLTFGAEHEIKFHGRLYSITGNETLKNFQNLLLPVFGYVIHSGLLNDAIRPRQYVSHNCLVDMLKTGKPKVFREGMRMHLDSHFKRIFSRQ